MDKMIRNNLEMPSYEPPHMENVLIESDDIIMSSSCAEVDTPILPLCGEVDL